MKYVLDASAIVAYVRKEPGGTVVRDLIVDAKAACYAHSMNLCEVYYQTIRQTNAPMAAQMLTDLYSDGVIERRDMSRRFWHRVGEHKARGGISLPDCFCISLAQVLSATVVTSDHGEFDPLVPLGIVPIMFIR